MRSKLVTLLLQLCWTLGRAVGSNPVMTHTSMDVGNIISIIIPESPDTNINVDQLTDDFRRQLERIRKQSRVNKLEHGLVTLKNVLPEMSKEEKKKTLPLIRRVLQTRRAAQPANNATKSASQRKNQGKKGQSPAAKKKEKSKSQKKTAKPTKKPEKTPKTTTTTERFFDAKIDESKRENNIEKEYFFVQDYREPIWREDLSPADKRDISTNTDFDKNEETYRRTWERDINRSNRRAQFRCSEGETDEDRVRNSKNTRSFEPPESKNCPREYDVYGRPLPCSGPAKVGAVRRDEEPTVINYPINIDPDEFKGLERVLQTPQEQVNSFVQMNSSEIGANFRGVGEETILAKRNMPDENPDRVAIVVSDQEKFNPEEPSVEFYELNDKRRNFMINGQVVPEQIAYTNLEAIPNGRQLVNYANENMKIRVQRSVDNSLEESANPEYRHHPPSRSTVSREKKIEKKIKSPTGKIKKPWKSYPRSLDKQLNLKRIS